MWYGNVIVLSVESATAPKDVLVNVYVDTIPSGEAITVDFDEFAGADLISN